MYKKGWITGRRVMRIPASAPKYQIMVYNEGEHRWVRFVGSRAFCDNIAKVHKDHTKIPVNQWPEE